MISLGYYLIRLAQIQVLKNTHSSRHTPVSPLLVEEAFLVDHPSFFSLGFSCLGI